MDAEELAIVEGQAAQIENLTTLNQGLTDRIEAMESAQLDRELAALTPVTMPELAHTAGPAVRRYFAEDVPGAKVAGVGVYYVSDQLPYDAEVSYGDGLVGYICSPSGLKDLAGADVVLVRQGLEDDAQVVVVPRSSVTFTGRTRRWEYVEDGDTLAGILVEG